MRASLLVLFFTLLLGCSTTKAPHTQYMTSFSEISPDAEFQLSISGEDQVPFRGLVNYDSVQGGQYAGLYPGGSGAIFAAAILVHSVAAESSKNTQKNELQAKADRVLEPYKPIISTIKSIHLLSSIEDLTLSSTEDFGSSAFYLESSPLFLMSSDENTILLKNVITVYSGSSENHRELIYRNLVEVYSPFIKTNTPQSHWLSNDGSHLKMTSKSLYAESIRLALADIKNILLKDEPEKTFSYFQSEEKKYERGRLVNEQEGRIAIRTLRGWIKSFPIKS